MSMRYKGGVLSATAATSTTNAATGVWTLRQQMQAQAASAWPAPLLPPFNLTTSSDGGVNTYRTLGVDPVYNQLYIAITQDPSAQITRFNIASDGTLSATTPLATSTGSVPVRQITFQPPSSSQAIITGYAQPYYALFSSRANMFGTSSNVNLGSEFQSFNPWACAYTSSTLMIVSGTSVDSVSPFPTGEGIVVVNLATNAIRGVALTNASAYSLTSGMAYDPGSQRLYVGLGANTSNTGLINVYQVNNPSDYATMSFTYIEQINTNFGVAIEAIGCSTNYLWYGGNNYANIRRCARS
jgi:hypothetical protein